LKELLQFDDDSFIYKLVGVNIHVGTADHGHYYSIINTNRGIAEADPY
jgi:ubiquitin C-terminal hydrolase